MPHDAYPHCDSVKLVQDVWSHPICNGEWKTNVTDVEFLRQPTRCVCVCVCVCPRARAFLFCARVCGWSCGRACCARGCVSGLGTCTSKFRTDYSISFGFRREMQQDSWTARVGHGCCGCRWCTRPCRVILAVVIGFTTR